MTEHIPREPFLDVEKVLPILDKIIIFGGLSEAQLYQIFKRLKLVHYQAGETIFSVGDSASYIYIVETGRVDLFYEVAGKPVLKAELLPGTCFGDISVIGIQPHTASTVAVEKTDLLVLSGEALDDIFRTDLALFSMLVLNIAREACRRLHKTNRQLVNCLAQYPEAIIEDIESY
ncbi:MAG: cyclic nucleotide-binding domain-containing protein [Gammaproteobacteria bacterium]|uniref:Crp/Fnr family transcriptional regulator n=1 Tax=Pseudomaricurvus alcaniphilus TaxID=1166482 RepID=UPI00140A48E7|nr:cyclic nucleotide-binding domain-containing protein [Pseudomaricurvus alcaniphilus]MBR9908906.1 cyclic nucleotide-binding domain-containing protein [Gammaproteobacteria bacterium]NHN37959.1 cyclic nucleotide-binding domain-containing protein [Pseudomaricurvus alcaniphilus]